MGRTVRGMHRARGPGPTALVLYDASTLKSETGRPLLISVFEGNHRTTSLVHLARRETTVQPSPCPDFYHWSGFGSVLTL